MPHSLKPWGVKSWTLQIPFCCHINDELSCFVCPGQPELNTFNQTLLTLLYFRTQTLGPPSTPPPQPVSRVLRSSFQSKLTPLIHSAAIMPTFPLTSHTCFFLVVFTSVHQERLGLPTLKILTASCLKHSSLAIVLLPSSPILFLRHKGLLPISYIFFTWHDTPQFGCIQFSAFP